MSMPSRSRWCGRSTAGCRNRRRSSVRQVCWSGWSGRSEQAEAVWSLLRGGAVRLRSASATRSPRVHNLVVCPQSWDELSTGVKTDKSDARALCVRLALYAAGNRRIFSVVRVPTPEQEQARAESRLREQLRRTRQRIEAQGRSLLLAQGHRVTGRWWQPRTWLQLSGTLPGWLVELLEPLRECILTAHQKTERLTQTVQEAAGDSAGWVGGSEQRSHRPGNRRLVAFFQPASDRQLHRPVSRRTLQRRLAPAGFGDQTRQPAPAPRAHRNGLAPDPLPARVPRRATLDAVLSAPTRNAAARKKAIVAVARQLAVDLWRIRTGRVQRRSPRPASSTKTRRS